MLTMITSGERLWLVRKRLLLFTLWVLFYSVIFKKKTPPSCRFYFKNNTFIRNFNYVGKSSLQPLSGKSKDTCIN